MKDFMFIYRHQDHPFNSPEEKQAYIKKWLDWLDGLAAQNKLASKGERLGSEGNVVRPGNVITDGPYSEVKEFIGGFNIISAASLNEATEIARGCPILEAGGNVEVRNVEPL